MKIEMTDKFYFPETERKYTPEGYLIVPASISRPGTQIYKAIELVETTDQLPPEYNPNDIITVYRPPCEVFKTESVDSFKNIAVTNNHPPEFLNSKNYRKYAVGTVLSDVSEDGKHVKATLKITDQDTINDINDGKVDVSAGYHSMITFEKGETEDGESYQAVQRDIAGNHVAVVKRGRAGSEVKLADGLDRPSERSESLTAEGVSRASGSESAETLKKSGEEEEEFGADGVPGSNISTPFGDEKEITESVETEDEVIKENKELTMKLEDAMTKIDELTKANEKLSSQVLDQAGIDTLVEDRMQLIDSCLKLVDTLEYMGKSNSDLKKAVLQDKMPNVDLADKTEEYINAAFDVLQAGLNDSLDGKHDEEVYGEDLELQDEKEDGVEKPEGEAEPTETTKNVHEGENPDDSGEDGANDEPDKEVETKDSASVLDSAFESEVKQVNQSKELSAYDKYCERSRNAWKKDK